MRCVLLRAWQVGGCEVRDAAGRKVRMHADTPEILRALRGRGCGIAVASLNPDAERCTKLLAAFGILTLLETSLIQVSLGVDPSCAFTRRSVAAAAAHAGVGAHRQTRFLTFCPVVVHA